MKEVPLEGGGLEQARRECLDREWWRLFCCGHPLGGRVVWDVMRVYGVDGKLLSCVK